MREYIKSRTFWLIFLTAFIAVAGIMLGIFMYVWQGDIKKERQALLAENMTVVADIYGYVEEICQEETMLASRLLDMEWVQKIASGSDVFAEAFDHHRRSQIAGDFLFYTAQSDVMTKRFVVFPYQDVCIGSGIWADVSSYFGALGIAAEAREPLLQAIAAQNRPFSIETGAPRGGVLACIPIERLNAPRAYICSVINGTKLEKKLLQMMNAGVIGVRIFHAEDGDVLMEAGDCRMGGKIRTDRRESSYIDWEYEFFIDEQTVVVRYSGDALSPLGRFSMMAALCLGVAWALAMLFYRPVMKLMAHAGIQSASIRRGTDDYKAIEAHIDAITDRYHRERRVALLHELLNGYFTQDEGMLRAAGLEIGGEDCCQVILCVEQGRLSAEQRGESRMMLERFFQERKMRCEMTATLYGELAILMLGRDDTDLRRVSLQELRERLGGDYAVYAGNPIRGLVGVSLSYQMARERCQRIAGLSRTRYYLPIEWELQLIDALLKGKRQVAMGICTELRRENERRLESGKLQSRDYDRLMGTLLKDFNRALGENGAEGNEALDNVTRAYQQENAEAFWDGVSHLISSGRGEDGGAAEAENAGGSVAGYIDAHYADHEMSMQAICEAFSMSANTINKCVKAATGMTFYAYLTQRRMERAKVLLAGGASVAEVADRVGYDTDYSFRRAFQRYTGVKAQDFTAADAQSGEGDAEKVE